MRKDEIEERIISIEQNIRDITTVQREQGMAILSELKSFQNMFIEEKIETMRKQVVLGHQRLLLDLVIATVRREFESVCPNPCSLFERGECIDFFICRLRESAERMDPEETSGYLANQVKMDEELLTRYPELGEMPCQTCYAIYAAERDQLMTAIGELSATRTAINRQKNAPYIRDLPEDEVLTTIIEPLSHPVRFGMLKALARGTMSYTELSTLTGYKGGHLLFHVTRLIEAGLIAKSSSGQYTITEKGMGMMDLIRKIYAGI